MFDDAFENGMVTDPRRWVMSDRGASRDGAADREATLADFNGQAIPGVLLASLDSFQS